MQADFTTGEELPMVPLVAPHETFFTDLTRERSTLRADYWFYFFVDRRRHRGDRGGRPPRVDDGARRRAPDQVPRLHGAFGTDAHPGALRRQALLQPHPRAHHGDHGVGRGALLPRRDRQRGGRAAALRDRVVPVARGQRPSGGRHLSVAGAGAERGGGGGWAAAFLGLGPATGAGAPVRERDRRRRPCPPR